MLLAAALALGGVIALAVVITSARARAPRADPLASLQSETTPRTLLREFEIVRTTPIPPAPPAVAVGAGRG